MSGAVIVARSTSRHGGRCQQCGRRIAAGGTIVKLDNGDRGGTTSGGNGLGCWVCEACATETAL